MPIKCAIDIMKRKEYIEVEHMPEYSYVIDVFRIKAKNIYDRKKADEIIKTMENEIIKSDEYIVAVQYVNGHICFAKKEDVINFVESFISLNVEYKQYRTMPFRIKEWIENEYPNISISGSDGYPTHITDINKRMKRKKEEEQNDKEALDLLNNIL